MSGDALDLAVAPHADFAENCTHEPANRLELGREGQSIQVYDRDSSGYLASGLLLLTQVYFPEDQVGSEKIVFHPDLLPKAGQE